MLYSFQDSPTSAMNTNPEAYQKLRQPQDQFDSRPTRVQLKIVPKLELEERICVCGCERRWKCMPSSPSKYFSVAECAPQATKPERLEFTNQRSYQFDADAKQLRKKSSV